MRYTLMHQDYEVLEFELDPADFAVLNVRPLEDSARMPLGMVGNEAQAKELLKIFLDSRCLAHGRDDLQLILKVTGTRHPWELALRSGGFSLQDQYWYRSADSGQSWKHCNFYDNDWDPGFGKAVLKGDYDALGHVSPVTPDLTCGGLSRKAWLRDDVGPLLLKADDTYDGLKVQAETLASRMLSRLLPPKDFVAYERVELDGQSYSSCRPLVDADEDLALAWQVLLATEGPQEDAQWSEKVYGDELLEHYQRALNKLDVLDWEQARAKQDVFSQLTINLDLHSHNMGVVRNARVGVLRAAPLFDFDCSFALANQDQMEWLCAHEDFMPLAIASRFSALNPSADYSWYDPHALDGFEEEIEKELGSNATVPQGFPHLIASLFAIQRSYVNSVASG